MKRSRGRGRKPSNSLNRTMESNGPDVKVRGTPHQICDKYLALARDANVAGDRIAYEGYLQHAEHYHRIIQSTQQQQPNNGQQQQPSPQNNNAEMEEEGAGLDGNVTEEVQPQAEQQQRPARARRPRRTRQPRSTAKDGDNAEAKDAKPADEGEKAPAAEAPAESA